MPVTTRKAKPLARKYIEEDEALEESDDNGTTFDKVFGHATNDSDPEPDFRKARPKSRRSKGKGGKKPNGRKRKPTRAPTLPEMSDDENRRAGDTPELDEFPVHFDEPLESLPMSVPATKRAKTLPQVLQIHVDASKSNGKATINLNIADLISLQASKPSRTSDTVSPAAGMQSLDEDETLVEVDIPKHRSKRAKLFHDTKAQRLTTKSTKTGFTDLPYELRVAVYRQALVKKVPLQFNTKEGFSRSSQFLRTCKLVHEEGREIMYGENSFHFSRSDKTRGTYFESDWREIGFKDIRRFLEDIGPVNISFLKYVSFYLGDAAPSLTPYLEEEQRRCVNDPVLHRVFKLIGSHATLNKFTVAFQVRRTIVTSDYVFLKALSSIKCHQFGQSKKWYFTNRLSYGIMDRLQKVMVIKKEEDEDVDLSKKKTVEPEMFLED